MEEEIDTIKPERKKKKRWLLKIMYFFIALFIILDLFLFFFATPVIKSYIQGKVYEKTSGLFAVDFSRISIELSTRSLTLEGFELIPDTIVYNKLNSQNQTNTALYSVSSSSVKLWNTSIYKLFFKSKLNAKELQLIDPIIELKKLPAKDTLISESRDFVHQDLFPAISEYLSEVKIKNINLENGRFLLNLNKDSIGSTTHIGYISVKLFNFLLNKEEFIKKNKLFYSEDLQIDISNYKVNLNDNIHYLYANNINISTKNSKLIANNIGMRPINESRKFLATVDNNYFRIQAPEIEFKNFDIYDFYFEKDINIGMVAINIPSIEIVNILKKIKQKTSVYNKTLELDLSQLISGSLNSIMVDSFYVNNGSLKFYYNNWQDEPVYKARQISLDMKKFDLKENSNNIQTKIFYADELTLRIDTFSTILPDQVHFLTINSIDFSTIDRSITASKLILTPYSKARSINRLAVSIPLLNIKGADFFNLYHQRIFNMASLSISPSNFKIRIAEKNRLKKQTDDRKNPLEIITTNFVKQLSIRSLHLGKSSFELTQFSEDSISTTYKGKASFELKRFFINPITFESDYINLFYADKFRLILNNYQQELKDRIHFLESNTLEVSNIDSIIEITGFKIRPKNDPDSIFTLNLRNKIFEIDLIQTSIKGIDIDKAYNDSSLIANSISLLRPEIKVYNYFQNKGFKTLKNRLIDSIPDNSEDDEKNKSAESNSNETFRSLLATYFSKIDINALNIEQANVTVTDIDTTGEKDLVMSGSISARLNKFYFNPHFTNVEKQISYSDNISFRVRDYFGKLFNKKYQLKVKQARFSSKDSIFSASLVRLFPTRENESSKHTTQLWTFYAPGIESRNVKISELIDFNILYLGKLNIDRPSLALTQKVPTTKKTLMNNPEKIKKTMGLKSIKFDEINVKQGVFGVLKDNFNFENLSVNTKIDIQIRQLEIDSTSFIDPELFLDNLDASIILSEFHYQLPDSLHFIDLKRVSLNTLPKEINIDSIKYYSTSNKLDKNRSFTLNEFFIPKFNFYGFEFSNLLINKKINADLLVIEQPDFNIITQKNIQNNKQVKLSELNLYDKINKHFKALNIKNIDINNASILHSNREFFNPKNTKYANIHVNISGLLVDSLHQQTENLLNAEDISVQMDDYGLNFSDSLYKLNIKEFGFSTGRKSFFANSINLNPTKGREEYAKLRQKEISLNYLKTKSLTASGVDFQKLIDQRQFLINNIDINNIQFHTYKNKQYPLDSVLKIPLPLQYVLRAKDLIKIDTIKLHNAYLGHEILGKNALENGFIDFTNIDAEIINLTNDKKSIEKKEETVVKASGYLMDQSLLTTSFHFPLDSKSGEYYYGGTLDTLDMKSVNPLLENLVFISINDGIIKNINFSISANDDYAEGKLKMIYDDLKIDLISKKKSDSLVIEKRGLFSMVANSIIKDSNPKRKGGFTKEGRVYFERNPYKSVFNYWTFSLLSGMRSTLGFKSKQLKERLKLEKGSEKYAKKFNRKSNRINKRKVRTIENQIQKELKDEEKNRKKEERKKKKNENY